MSTELIAPASGARIRALLVICLAAIVGFALLGAPNAEAKGSHKGAKAHKKHKHHKKKHKRHKKQKRHKAPRGLAFYKAPKKLIRGHGKLIWSRNARPALKVAGAKKTKLVLYSSKNPAGKRVAVSGVVSIPRGVAPKHGWPVITYAHGTTGIADICAPSRNGVNGPAYAYSAYTDPQVSDWLKAGYAVMRTDYQGLGTPGVHQYLIGVAEGRSVLDIVRAARQLDRNVSKRFVIAGHSQGGHAALWAAGLAAKWTPDLKLKGTVAYAPASQLKTQAGALNLLTSPSPLSSEASLVVRGAQANSPSTIKPAQLLSDQAYSLYPETTKLCLSGLAASDSFGGLAPSTLIRDGADRTGLYKVLEDNNPDVKTDQPIYLAQGTADTTVLPAFTTMLDGQLTALGDQVDYVKYPGVDHGNILNAAEADVLPWIEQHLFNGR